MVKYRNTPSLHGLFRLCWVSLFGGTIGLNAVALGGSSAPPPLTVADSIETARFHRDHNDQSVFVSPDGQRYVVLTIRGDLNADGVWMELLSGTLGSIDSAAPRPIHKFFTRGLAPSAPIVIDPSGPSALLTPGLNIPVWLSNEEVALLWDDGSARNQIFALDLQSRQVRQLTHEATDVVAFTFRNGSLAYDVKRAYRLDRSRELIQAGFSVKSPDSHALLSYMVDGAGIFDLGMCDRVVGVLTSGRYEMHPAAGTEIYCGSSQLGWGVARGLKPISPDGRWGIFNVRVTPATPEWSRYGGHFAEQVAQARMNPHGLDAASVGRFELVDMASGQSRPLWAAPVSYDPESTFSWSPDSTHVLIGPTMLPLSDRMDVPKLANGFAIIDIKSGAYEQIRGISDLSTSVFSSKWLSLARIALTLRDGKVVELEQVAGRWRRAASNGGDSSKKSPAPGPPSITVVVRESMNSPPILVATDKRTRATRVLFDPNPDLLSRYSLGQVEMTRWRSKDGQWWEGRLYYPAHFRRGARYPLVIQTKGCATKDQFSLYGQASPEGIAMGPGWSVYLAQSLASQDIAVLQMGGPLQANSSATDFEVTVAKAKELQNAVEYLDGLGIVDRRKVGIMGHSAGGRIVEQALAFTEFPYAAAIVADSYEINYLQSAGFGWMSDEGMPPPFGRGLEAWLNRAPAFNVERIRTPLQIELTTGGEGNSTLLWGWEMFSRLRYLKKPVEYYVLPDIKHGGHLVQNPRQLLALQNRALDWWLFWLAGVKDPAPEKKQQYLDWAELKKEYDADKLLPKVATGSWRFGR